MIAEIILKKLREQLNREEEILFKKWLSENDENFLTYKRLKELHRNNVLLQNINAINQKESWNLISAEIQKNIDSSKFEDKLLSEEKWLTSESNRRMGDL